MLMNDLNNDGVFWAGVAFVVVSIVVGILIKVYVSKQR